MDTMTTNRLEAFSDGVLAIIITIMVLELKVPEGDSLSALEPLMPTFMTYVLSFIYLGIYWSNHHHLMHSYKSVNGKILWANLHLLFWLSLFPFATGYMGENHFQELPTALYGFVLSMASIAWNILQKTLQYNHPDLNLKPTNKLKPIFSIILYILATGISFVYPIAAASIYVLVAIYWFLPNDNP
jgi:uncharacterized membrane protein